LPALAIRGLEKRYGQMQALAPIDLTLEGDELVCVVGPSGCGKTTLLRAVAGLVTPDGGRIEIGDDVVFDAATRVTMGPERRGVGLVYQDYALWPHLTVREHLAFPMESRRTPVEERAGWITRLLELVHLQEYGDRRPGQLSGGQQQRVALARALSGGPRLLLMDEPMSNLDARLRTEMRGEIVRLVKQLGVATLYVTHDQAEAMSIADRIVVLRNGVLIQQAPPAEIFEQPADTEVADFFGIGAQIPASAAGDERVRLAGGAALNVEGYDLREVHSIVLPLAALTRAAPVAEEARAAANLLDVVVESAQYEGGDWSIVATVAGSESRVRFRAAARFAPGVPLLLRADPHRILPFKQSGQRCPATESSTSTSRIEVQA